MIKGLTPQARESIEAFMRPRMTQERGHDVEHVLRVRDWAMRIGGEEDFEEMGLLEAAALLHDVGLGEVEDRRAHGRAGASVARDFLTAEGLFDAAGIEAVCHAVEWHCSNRGGDGPILDILRDADMQDMFGAVGVLRGIAFASHKRLLDPAQPKGGTWGMGAKEFNVRFDSGIGHGETIMDVLNFHISCYDNLATEAGRRLARPKVQYIRDFILAVEEEVSGNVRGAGHIKA